MSVKVQTLKYAIAAIALASVIIGATVLTNPNGGSTTSNSTTTSSQVGVQSGSPNFLVLLTDPPNVPPGTQQLNLTYSGIGLHTTFPNGTSEWVQVQGSGTVNLLRLVNYTKTIASASIPAGSVVDKIEFVISSVKAVVNNTTYPVTTLASDLIVSIRSPKAVNQTVSGTLLDFRPTLIRIPSTNATGSQVDYYVLSPSATAVVKSHFGENETHVGVKALLMKEDSDRLDEAQAHESMNVTITSASISATGNLTKISVTLKNTGTTNATAFGLILQGDFNASLSLPRGFPSPPRCQSTTTFTTTTTTGSTSTSTTQTTTKATSSESEQSHTSHTPASQPCEPSDEGGNGVEHPGAIPFRINGTNLVPLLGGSDHDQAGRMSRVTLKPGQSVTLSFVGVLQASHSEDQERSASQHASIVIVPIAGKTYTMRLAGEGFETLQVTAA